MTVHNDAQLIHAQLTREGRADEIKTARSKPFLNKLVDDGKLDSQGWQTHVIGGNVRKLQTMTVKGVPTLIASRTVAVLSMYRDDSAMGQEFAEVCGSHVDYIWNDELGKEAGARARLYCARGSSKTSLAEMTSTKSWPIAMLSVTRLSLCIWPATHFISLSTRFSTPDAIGNIAKRVLNALRGKHPSVDD